MKTEKYDISTEYRDIAEEVINEEKNLAWLRSVRIEYIKSEEAKVSHTKIVYAQCMKIQEIYQTYIPYDFFVVVYAPNVAGFSRDQKKMLMHHELLHIGVDISREGEPLYKIVPHDVEEFREIIDKYGLDWSR